MMEQQGAVIADQRDADARLGVRHLKEVGEVFQGNAAADDSNQGSVSISHAPRQKSRPFVGDLAPLWHADVGPVVRHCAKMPENIRFGYHCTNFRQSVGTVDYVAIAIDDN